MALELIFRFFLLIFFNLIEIKNKKRYDFKNKK